MLFSKVEAVFPNEEAGTGRVSCVGRKIVYSRADAIVSGQYRNHYGETVQLLAIVGEIKESMGSRGAKAQIFAEYKRKFPRHLFFQKEMKTYF